MEQVLMYLHSIYPLPEDLKEHLRKIIKVRKVKKKEYILEAGFVCRHLFFIQQGLLRCFYPKGSDEITTWLLKEGDYLTSVHIYYSQAERVESIHALENTVLYLITKDDLDDTYLRFPIFRANALILSNKYLQMWDKQLRSLRMLSATERFELFMKEQPDLLLRVSQKYIASYLDMTPETFSRMKDNYGKRE
jgi:CRP-like cAMP-binding protein